MRTTRVIPFALAGLMALGATGCAGTEFKKDAPQTAVRNFLAEALVQQNGQRACDFLTPAAQKSFEPGIEGRLGAAPKTTEEAQVASVVCRDAMEKSSLVDGDRRILNVGDVNSLDYSTKREGDAATVTVKADGRTMTFRLEEADPDTNLYVSENPWRIVDGAKALVTGTA